jgi:hypothetical protein
MWWTIGAFLAGLVVGTLVTFVFFAEQLAPWIKWKEQVMQKEMALAELRMAGKLNEQGHKRSEFRSEL